MAAARENWFEVFEEPGHEGHCRKKQVPTGEPVLLTPPQGQERLYAPAVIDLVRDTGRKLRMDPFASFRIVINICMVLRKFIT